MIFSIYPNVRRGINLPSCIPKNNIYSKIKDNVINKVRIINVNKLSTQWF